MQRITKMLRSLARKQGGFTLMELLVVVAIMGVLAAVAVPNVARFANRGQTQALATELQSVQSATDAYMAENALATITGTLATATAITDFDVASPGDLYPDYLRQETATTGYGYCWSNSGTVRQKADTANCDDPTSY